MASACHLSSLQVTLQLKRSTLHRRAVSHEGEATDSGGQPSDGGLHELAASRRHSLTIARQLVVSYATFSPLPLPSPTRGRRRTNRGGHSLLPAPTVASSFCFRKWSALCCPDFPLARLRASGKPEHCYRVQRYEKND